jgi:hypothetical protein
VTCTLARNKDRLDGRLCRAYELAEHVASEVGQSPLDIIVRLLTTSNEQANLFVLDQRAQHHSHQIDTAKDSEKSAKLRNGKTT